jgi:SAM-dependent methyltransferase
VTDWFARWFGDDYLRMYPHRNDDDASEAVGLVAAVVNLAGARVLDLACGPGRHSVQLARRGAWVVGIDLSQVLLLKARHAVHPPLALVRGDMRALPFRPASVDIIVNLFTSFGYFEDDAQHLAVLQSAAALLKPKGTMVMDYLNAEQVARDLVPTEVTELGGQRVQIQRRLVRDGRYVEKEMRLLDSGATHLERVRLFHPRDLVSLFELAGLSIEEQYGDYHRAPLTPYSPRAVLVARKP